MKIQPHAGNFKTILLIDVLTKGVIYHTLPIPGLHVTSDCSHQPDGGKNHEYLHFAEEQTETQNSWVICPCTHSW